MTEVLITLPFKRRFKDLSKRYLKIQGDITVAEIEDAIGQT
ncbi:hypothetical protein [Chamaesiphon sp. GL140_3_metabinner_50]|nr:hypothetical protein [Chamaesiphon sp. GL140_3_metabinner_50]